MYSCLEESRNETTTSVLNPPTCDELICAIECAGRVQIPEEVFLFYFINFKFILINILICYLAEFNVWFY